MTELKMNRTVSQVSQDSTNGNTIVSARNRRRIWFWTLNNYTDEDIVSLSHNIWNNCPINKYVFQEEIGGNGTKHLQGVTQFENQVSFSTLKEFNDRVHWEKDKMGLKACIKYCSKEDTRNGKLYTYGDVEKMLWKDKPKNTMTSAEIWEDMRRQSIADIETNDYSHLPDMGTTGPPNRNLESDLIMLDRINLDEIQERIDNRLRNQKESKN
jgi:hypothetical protein